MSSPQTMSSEHEKVEWHASTISCLKFANESCTRNRSESCKAKTTSFTPFSRVKHGSYHI